MVVLTYMMLHTKFQGHGYIGSGEDFLRFLPYMGMAAMLVNGHVTQLISINFHLLFSLKLSYEFWFQISPLFLRKTSFNTEI